MFRGYRSFIKGGESLLTEYTPTITMSRLGKKGNGLFGNQIFQYSFLKIYAKHYHLKVETPEWIGQYLFGHQNPPITKQLPEVRPHANDLNFKDPIYKDVDFRGYFQYNTKFYSLYKEYFRSLFKPVTKIETEMKKGLEVLQSKGKTIVGLHLRKSVV